MISKYDIRTITRKEYAKKSALYHEFIAFDCTSKSPDQKLAHDLSPFYLGPVVAGDGEISKCFENFYQWSKVGKDEYDIVSKQVTPDFFAHRKDGFAKPTGHKKRTSVLFSLYMIDGEWKRLGYITSRKLIYIPEYAKLVVKTESFQKLKAMAEEGKKLLLVDFDGRDFYEDKKLTTLKDMVNERKVMGHTLVLKMLLEGDIEVVDGQVIDHVGVLKVGPNLLD